MTTKSAEASTPWYLDHAGRIREEATDRIVAQTTDGGLASGERAISEEEERATAAFIVLAANSHHAMVSALQEALIYFEDREDINYEGTGPNAAMSLAMEIRAALSLTKEI